MISGLYCVCGDLDEEGLESTKSGWTKFEGLIEFIIGLAGFLFRFPLCDVVFPVCMGLLGLDKFFDQWRDDSVKAKNGFMTDENYKRSQVIVFVLSIFTYCYLRLGGCPQNKNHFDVDYGRSSSRDCWAVLVMAAASLLQYLITSCYKNR